MSNITAPQSLTRRHGAPGARGSARFAAVWNGRHAVTGALGTTASHDAAVLGVSAVSPRGVCAPALPGRAPIGVLGAVAPSTADSVLGAAHRWSGSVFGGSDAVRRLRVLPAR
jgi:hypothetical protein